MFDYVGTICKCDENEELNKPIIQFKNKGHKSKTFKKDNKHNPKNEICKTLNIIYYNKIYELNIIQIKRNIKKLTYINN